MSLLSRRAGRALSLAFFPLAAAAALFGASVPEAEAVPPCYGGTTIYSGGTLVGCMFPTWGTSQQSMCNGAVYIPPESKEGCHICVVSPLDAYVLDPNKWSIFTPSDFSCRLDTPSEGGWCEDGRYCDANGCLDHDSPFSVAMCQCKLLDPACGIGECVGNSYCEGGSCDFPVCYSPDADISKALCGGYSLNPPECKAEGCQPHTDHHAAGVADDFSTANGTEQPAPSNGLLKYIASVYPNPGSRDFDAVGGDRWFGHTFTGLTPPPGQVICGARLTVRIGKGKTGLNNNDSLGLFFTDESGKTFGSSYGAGLTSFGIGGGSSATITLDLGNLPGGINLLPELEQNGFLDFIVQDDHAVDFLDLEIDYCCACTPHSEVFEAGVDDGFDGSNGPETPAPSGSLLNYIATNYAYPGSRDLDEIGGDRWFGHTFTGLQPDSGEYICGARLITRVGKGETGLNNNDSLGLFFLENGKMLGSSFGAALTDFGISNGSSALVTLDLANLPGGLNLLPEIAQNGWLDYIVQDDHAVDFARLEIDYCCLDDQGDGGLPPVDPQPSPGDVPLPADSPVATEGPATLEPAPAAGDLGN